MQFGQQSCCAYCGADMEPARRAVLAHCGQPLCAARHGRAEARKGADLIDRAARARREKLAHTHAALLSGLAQEERVAPEALAIEPVPHLAPQLVPVSEARRAAFFDHLETVLVEAFAVPAAAVSQTYDRRVAEGTEPAVVAPACAGCRGRCCKMGAEHHAFVKLRVIQSFRLRDPSITPDALRDLYAAHVPEEASEGGCLFQGPAGCTLPRDWRAQVCNQYHCDVLERLIQRLKEAPPQGPVVVVAMDEGDEPGVVSVMATDGSWREVER